MSTFSIAGRLSSWIFTVSVGGGLFAASSSSKINKDVNIYVQQSKKKIKDGQTDKVSYRAVIIRKERGIEYDNYSMNRAKFFSKKNHIFQSVTYWLIED